MLKPSECFAGPISVATEMSLVIPRNRYERLVLITINSDGKKHAICLSGIGQGRFTAFECDTNDDWAGLHIPGVQIELDEASLTDSDGHFPTLGSMVRKDDSLSACIHLDGRMPGRGGILLPILSGLPPCAERSTAYFLKWQIVLGDGDAKRVLHVVDLLTEASK